MTTTSVGMVGMMGMILTEYFVQTIETLFANS